MISKALADSKNKFSVDQILTKYIELKNKITNSTGYQVLNSIQGYGKGTSGVYDITSSMGFGGAYTIPGEIYGINVAVCQNFDENQGIGFAPFYMRLQKVLLELIEKDLILHLKAILKRL